MSNFCTIWPSCSLCSFKAASPSFIQARSLLGKTSAAVVLGQKLRQHSCDCTTRTGSAACKWPACRCILMKLMTPTQGPNQMSL